MLSLLFIVLMSLPNAHGTTRKRALDGMVAGVMARDRAGRAIFEAAARRRLGDWSGDHHARGESTAKRQGKKTFVHYTLRRASRAG